MIKLKVCVLLILILISGCVKRQLDTYIQLTIDSISSDEIVPKKAYYLFPGNQDTTLDNLEFKEFSEYIHQALSSHGYKLVNDIDKADTAIYLAYGIGAPETHTYTKTTPTFGVTGVSSSTTHGSISSTGNFSATTTYNPTYGITGSSTSVGTYSTYFKYLVIDAYDVDRSGGSSKLRQIFKTTITNDNTNDDLRSFFPNMAIASTQYIGTNTRQKIEISFSRTDYGRQLSKLILQFSGNTVSNIRTGLMWTKNANLAGKRMTWEEAKQYVSNLDYGGYRDWRLPTIQELQSIAKFGGTNAADGLNEIGFSDVQWDYYWSSSPGDSFPKCAWMFAMNGSYGYEAYKSKNYRVWPVRNNK